MNHQESTHIYNVCLVKRTHHIKGKLYILNKNGLINKILFHSFPYEIAKKKPCCNVTKGLQHFNHKKEKICFGEIFVCPHKDMNIKIFIDIADVRLILQRIYFYRKTAIEIFTNTKSYYFNFAEDFNLKNPKKGETYCQNFINMMGYYYKTEFFPIKIKDSLMGYSRQFYPIVKKYSEEKGKNKDLMELENKFMSVLFDHWKPNNEDIEFSTFDMIVYLNLLSNRSYIDLFQYPIFPLLFFYEKNDDIFDPLTYPRNLNQHIGFQVISEKSKIRKNMIKYTFDEMVKEFEETEDQNQEIIEKPIYFKTHYSNNVYTSNFLIRFFPYSFISIELQGKNFDSPDRLFFSIQETFYNISYHKSDVRELIPEFYYFPEMFMNVNNINFHERSNGILVNDVEMPKELKSNGKISINNDIEKENYENSNYFLCFKFIEKMRNLLESKSTQINLWIDIIFGPKQRYDDLKKKKQYFRDETYVDFSKDKEKDFEKYVNDKNIMTSVEFGITPVQTLFNEKEIINYKNRKIIYDNNVKDNKELYKEVCKSVEKLANNENEKDFNVKKRLSFFSMFKRNSKSINNKNNNTYNIINDINDENNRENNNEGDKSNNIETNNEINNNSHKENKGLKNILKIIFQSERIELKGYNTGKVEIFINDQLYDELYDHNNEITSIDYNKRLNMFCTTSKDGFLCLYMYPNKLITSLKNPNGNYFDKVYLSSNPFPSILAFEEMQYEFFSFSINGFKILKISLFNLLDIQEKNKDLNIISFFNTNGGTFKDRLIFILKYENTKGKYSKCHIITVPFFEKEDVVDIKNK